MTRDDAAAALAQVSELVAPDGASLELIAVDEQARTIGLRLDLSRVECAECVLPRERLESLALAIMRELLPELRSVAIADPRDGSEQSPC